METFGSFENIKIDQILKEIGYQPFNNFHNQFRYSIINDQELMVILGIKIPIEIPIVHEPPVELVSFYLSLGIKPRRNDENFLITLRFIATSFKELIENLPPYTYDFNIEPYKRKIEDLINKYFPTQDQLDDEEILSETKVYAIIRNNFFQDQKTYEKYINLLSEDVLEIYKEFYLQPSNEYPPELHKGLPLHRKNWAVIFKRDEPDEYLIEEPGSISYSRDYHYKNCWIRTGLESHTLNIWYEAFEDQNFKLNYLIYDWLLYIRALTKTVFGTLDQPQYNSKEMAPINEIVSLHNISKKGDIPGLFLPKLVYEASLTQGLNFRTSPLFENPASSLEELSAISDYEEGINLLERENFPIAKKRLLEARRKLRKFHHQNGQVLVLFQLFSLSIKQNDYDTAIQYATEALELAKSGTISIEYIVKIHLSLIQASLLSEKKEIADKHLQIVQKFLKSLPTTPSTEKLEAEVYLTLAKLQMDLRKFQEANEFFKDLLKIAKKYPIYEFYYYYYRYFYYTNISKAQKALQALHRAIQIEESPLPERTNAFVQLGKYYLYSGNDPKKGISYINEALKGLKNNTYSNLKLKVLCYEMLADGYRILEDNDKASQMEEEVKNIRELLDRLV